MMSQREKLKDLIVEFCNDEGSRTFLLKGLNDKFGDYELIGIGGKTPQATVRRLLQELRDENFISFLDKSGCYTLRGIDLLDSEKEEIKTISIIDESPQKREHLIETYIRKTKWAEHAKRILGSRCLFKNCENSFHKEDGSLYIEVHHIIPLYKGGEDGIWNLSVLCAHHHRMAHFAVSSDIIKIENYLLTEVKNRI